MQLTQAQVVEVLLGLQSQFTETLRQFYDAAYQAGYAQGVADTQTTEVPDSTPLTEIFDSGDIIVKLAGRSISTIGELEEQTADKLSGIGHFGPKLLDLVRWRLGQHGRALQGEQPTTQSPHRY